MTDSAYRDDVALHRRKRRTWAEGRGDSRTAPT